MTAENHITVGELESIYNSLGCLAELLDDVCSNHPDQNHPAHNLLPYLQYIERDFAPIIDKLRSGDLLVVGAYR